MTIFTLIAYLLMLISSAIQSDPAYPTCGGQSCAGHSPSTISQSGRGK